MHNLPCPASHFTTEPLYSPKTLQLSGASPTFLPAMLSLSTLSLPTPPHPAPYLYRLEVFIVVGVWDRQGSKLIVFGINKSLEQRELLLLLAPPLLVTKTLS